ncbi:MAG: DsbA family protein [Patescibacteria group bacterium]
MHTKLHCKIYGAKEPGDLKIIEENLRSQEGVKNLKVAQLKNYIEMELDIEQNKSTKQQIIDIIKLSGDFRIEELSENMAAGVTTAPPKPVVDQAFSVLSSIDSRTEENRSKLIFSLGFLAGLAVISLFINIVFGYLLFSSSAFSFSGTTNAKNKQAALNVPSPQIPDAAVQPTATVQNFEITKSDHVRGNFNAPITLVEYSDFECPFCEKIYPTFKKLLSDYPDQVRLVYKHFPLGFHPNAQKAAEASECADEQGKFWEYHDTLFDNQANGFSLTNFKQWAEDLKLNTKKFNNCLDSGKYTEKVQADETDGQSRGVNGTPATFVNGQLVSGAVPYESFKSIIDQLISNN